MSPPGVAYRRLVLALSPDGASDQSLEAAARLAGLMRIDVLALCVEDERAYAAVSHVFTNEAVFGRPVLRAVDVNQLARDYRVFARRTERKLKSLTRGSGVRLHVESRRGEKDRVLATVLRDDDILATFEPAWLAISQKTEIAYDDVARTTFAIPTKMTAAEGVIAVVGDGEAAALARRLAGETGARIEKWEWDDAMDAPPTSTFRRDLRALDDPAIARRVLRDLVRLVIIGQDALNDDRIPTLRRLAAEHRTPVLALTSRRNGGEN